MERPSPNPFARYGTQRAFNTKDSEPEFLRIHRLVENGKEGQTADFKRIPYATTKRDDFLSDVCSFANTTGGLILLGVKENTDPPHTALGIDEDELENSLKRLSDWARKYVLPTASVVHFYKHTVQNATIIVISIQKSVSGPLYYEHHGGHVVKVRDGDGTRHARIDELSKLIKSSPASALQQQAALYAGDFRRQSFQHRSIFVEMYGDTEMISNISYPATSTAWPDHISNKWHIGMITDAQIIDVRQIPESMYPCDMVPMANENTIRNYGRIPARSIAYLLFEHKEGSGLREFEQLSDQASLLLRQTELDILYQVPSLYGITAVTLRDWVHTLIYSAFQRGSGQSQICSLGSNPDDLFPTEKELQSGSIYKRCKRLLPGDIRVLSANLLDEIAAFV